MLKSIILILEAKFNEKPPIVPEHWKLCEILSIGFFFFFVREKLIIIIIFVSSDTASGGEESPLLYKYIRTKLYNVKPYM